MNKTDLEIALAERSGKTKKACKTVVDSIFSSMGAALANQETVEIRGLGSFTIREYGAYFGRDPRTGASIRVGAKKLPHFKPSKAYRGEFMNGGKALRFTTIPT